MAVVLKRKYLFLTFDQLSALTTKRLLAYKNKIMRYPENPNWDECDFNRMNKKHPEWQTTYKNIKYILSTREHINK